MSLKWFATVLVHHPYTILIGITVFSGTCLIIPLMCKTFPNFSDPQMGFETRGTTLSNRATTWKNLMESTKLSGIFITNPKEVLNRRNVTFAKAKKKKNYKRLKADKNEGIIHHSVDLNEQNNHSNNNNINNWRTLEKIYNDKNSDDILPPLKKDNFFCGAPDEGYVQLVFKSKTGKDLFQLEPLFDMCRLQMELTHAEHYRQLCFQTSVRKNSKCCRPWSLVNYITLLNDRTSCLGITEEDVNATKALLVKCSRYYHSQQLDPDCSERAKCDTPYECIQHDAVFNIFNFLTSTTFLPPHVLEDVVLEETMIFLPLACSTAAMPYYSGLGEQHLSYRDVNVVAMEFGLKNTLFSECLLEDALLMIAGGVFVVICMWLYTKSLFLTIMTIIAIVFSLGISYFLYTLVFKLAFFPFMNLLAAIVAIGIGADDAFIFCKVWHSMKKQNENSLITVMTNTLYHALVSMFVTSLTTAAAFLASYVSSITAIRCFGVFTGTAVIANYLLMISWLPAAVALYERSWLNQCGLLKTCLLVCLERWCCTMQWKLSFSRFKTTCATLDKLWQTPELYILDAVIKFKFLLFIVFTLVAISSSLIVFLYPKLQLPDNNELQLFADEHPFERYDLVYKEKFWFKQIHKIRNSSISDSTPDYVYKLPLRFVWGVLAIDNGNYMDPQSIGELVLDNGFDVSSAETQKWLLNFCRELRTQSFYAQRIGSAWPANCFIESFVKWMARPCPDPGDETRNRAPCCEISKFPYESKVFESCMVDAMAEFYASPPEIYSAGVAGPRFSKDQTPTIKAFVIEYDSNYSFSMSYNHMARFLNEVEGWMERKLRTAPSGLKNGWFISDLEFYDLQMVLSKSMILAISISMSLAFLVLFLSTLNVLLSLYAIISITCSIITTMAVLVLIGWKLNILESVAISSSIGLTIDFSLHLSVSYKLCPISISEKREAATKYALNNILGPITMAAITTGAAGLFMMPSSVLAYRQIGEFLMIVMIVSWLFAVFHLAPFLAIIGPQRQFGQYHYTCCNKRKKAACHRDNRPNMSIVSESHELVSLTGKTSIQMNPNLRRSLTGAKGHASNRNPFADQSPSATSAITIMADDN